MTRIDDRCLDRIHPKQTPDIRPRRHQRRNRADDRDQVGKIERGDQLVPWRHRYADREQQRIGNGGRKEFVDDETAALQMRRDRAGELGDDREEQHGDRRRQAKQAVAHDAHQIERDGGKARGSHRADIDRRALLVHGFFMHGIHVVMFAGLQAPLPG